MHQSNIPQYTTRNRIFVLIGVLWDVTQVHCGIYVTGLWNTHTISPVTVKQAWELSLVNQQQ